jgi:hypothetical protein
MPVPIVLETEVFHMSRAKENMVAAPNPVQDIERSAGRDTDMAGALALALAGC